MARSSPHTAHTHEIQTNLREARFYHGCKNRDDLGSISTHGFRSEFFDEQGRWQRDGNLGKGIYLSCDWRTAVWFGSILLEATLSKGTKILDASPHADPRVLASLKREFGQELLTTGNIHQVLPKNKHLKLSELVELTRHFYHRVWDRDWKLEKSWRFSARETQARRALDYSVSLLKRYGFHGYGHPQDDNGIVIFAPDRIKLVRVVRALDPIQHCKLIDDQKVLENAADINALLKSSSS
jgi:hypothetical protein